MNLNDYYNHVLAGCDLFEAEQGVVYCFEKWVSKVYQWLQRIDTDPAIIFDWYSLNELNVSDCLSPGESFKELKELEGYLKAVSERFAWLARFPKGHLPGNDGDFLKALRQKSKSLGEKPEILIKLGLKLGDFTDDHLAHQNFHSWLKMISNHFQKLAPDSGLSAEWLSLPAITFYIGLERDIDLQTAVRERINWLGKIFGIEDINEVQVNAPIKKKKNKRLLEPLIDDLEKLEKTTVQPSDNRKSSDLLNINGILKEKEWLTTDELSIYIGYKKKTIYNWTSTSKIPFHKPNGKLMFNRKDIDAWIKEGGLTLRKVRL